MRIFFLCLLFVFVGEINAQTLLQFDKRYVQCEDKWVAFKINKDNVYPFGFIYIDAVAGLTFDSEGTFTVNEKGEFVAKKDTISVKYRLEPNQNLVAIIPGQKFKELGISEFPDWLKYYKTDTGSVQRLYRWGYFYNAWNESEKALIYLERAQTINSKFGGLEFELAFAYNALERYEKAVTVLKSAIATSPQDCLLYKELSFAEM